MLIYLLKSGVCLTVFYSFYKFLLEKESIHNFKRFYLLATLIAAFTIPLITFTQYVEVTPHITSQTTTEFSTEFSNNAIIETEPQQISYLPIILWSIYALGVFLFSLKFIKNFLALVHKIKRNPKVKNKTFTHVLLQDLITPHTFFNYIFFNKNKFETQQIPQEVILHEETHAKQKHSFDVLFIELLQIVFWFNPLVYFIKHSIKLNHEFLADQAVLRHGITPSTYQQILLAFSSNASETQLANAINYSSIKKRFTIMKTQTSKTAFLLRSLILLPLLAILIYSFSEKKEVVKKEEKINYFIENTNDSLINEVTILINKKNKVFLNNKPSSLNQLLADINKLNPNLTNEQKRNFLNGSIMYQSNTSKDLIKKIESILFQANIWIQSGTNLEIALKNKFKTEIPSLPLMSSENLSVEDKIIYQNLLAKYKEWLRFNNPNKKLIETKNGYIIKNENDKIIISTDPTIQAEPFELKKDSPWKVSTKSSDETFEESKSEIELFINKDRKVLINNKLIEFNKLSEELSTISNVLLKNNDSKPLLNIEIEGHVSMQYLEDIKNEVQKTNLKIATLRADSISIDESKYKTGTEDYYKGSSFTTVSLLLKNKKGELTKGVSKQKVSNEIIIPKKADRTEYDIITIKIPRSSNYKVNSTDLKLINDYTNTLVKKNQQKATSKEIKEYNTLAEKYNTQPLNKRFIKLKEVKRIEYIYSIMNNKQKANAEPFPNYPPPPPTTKIVHKGEISNIPEPQAAPKVKKGEISDIPQPPTPKQPLDHVIDMAKKGATFNYNGKKVTSDEAIALLKNNKSLNISTKTKDGIHIVNIKTDSIKL